MARAGRGWPLSTQYLQQPSVQTAHRMQGSATFRLTAENTTTTPRDIELQGTALSTPRIVGKSPRRDGMRAVCLNNDHVIVRELRQRNPRTGTFEPATNLGAVTGFLSLTVDGKEADAAPTLLVDMVELTDRPGVYAGTIQGEDLATALSSKVGQVVYERVTMSGDYSDSIGHLVQGVKVIQ